MAIVAYIIELSYGWSYCDRVTHYYQSSLLDANLGLIFTKTHHGYVRPLQDDSTIALWFIELQLDVVHVQNFLEPSTVDDDLKNIAAVHQ